MDNHNIQIADASTDSVVDDPFLWLEEREGQKALEWVHKQNEITVTRLLRKEFNNIYMHRYLDWHLEDICIQKTEKYIYQFYNSIWRRATVKEFRSKETTWEPVLDLVKLSKDENEDWYHLNEAKFLGSDESKCILSLERRASDKPVFREFDTENKTFVKDGFNPFVTVLDMNWINKDLVEISVEVKSDDKDQGRGRNYLIKRWKRDTDMDTAEMIKSSPDSCFFIYYKTPLLEFRLIRKEHPAHEPCYYLLENNNKLKLFDIPTGVTPRFFDEWMLLKLRDNWNIGNRTYIAGSLISVNIEDFLAGSRDFTIVYQPNNKQSLIQIHMTKSCLILNVLNNLKAELIFLKRGRSAWKRIQHIKFKQFINASIEPVEMNSSDEYLLTTESFLVPPTLYLGKTGEKPIKLKAAPHQFDVKGLKVKRYYAISKDGTRIPYTQVSKKDLKSSGSNPILMQGYGGFGIPTLPEYDLTTGVGWIDKGGVLVSANIRGGGEFGPEWHKSACREKRIKSYEDFASIAEDLISRRVTKAGHIAIRGGSNGGLLVGNMLTLYPHLFGAVVIKAPILDLKRDKLLDGINIYEYGNPDDPETWQKIKALSPYHNILGGMKYPPILIITSRTDDIAHPGHARKMAAKLQEYGYDCLFYEESIGGHNSTYSFINVLVIEYDFLLKSKSNFHS